ncbi:hypothetical protein [Pedobacter deserti]|uniref:hypothetical protein n=1 Tax=Pedobacter deserti TaxID=2817382 RepID=UPI00210C7172|nr:hypothetical protein [Pedobacter sp. SYSU D00382]
MKKEVMLLSVLVATLGVACSDQKGGDDTGSTTTQADTSIASTNGALALDTISLTSSKALSLNSKAQELMARLQRTLKSVVLDGTKFYVVEGDLLMDQDELYVYALKLLNRDRGAHGADKLTVATTSAGQFAKWPEGYVIKYSVLKRSFMSPQMYQQTVAWMQEATTDWMKACNVKFEYVPALDNGTVGQVIDPRLTFVVRQFNSNGAFVAQAFFPPDPPYRRKILLDYRFFSLRESKAGVLRHELGHVLGFRHEHIWRTGTDCPEEAIVEEFLGAQNLSEEIDCSSVMHYICGDCGSYEMKLSENDIRGAQVVYGTPKR